MLVGRARARLIRIGAVSLCLLSSACTEQPATSQAQDVRNLYYLILALAGAVFIGVEGTLLWSIVRFRRRKGDASEPPQREGRPRTIGLFFLVGAIIVAVLFPFGEITLARVEKNVPPIEAIDIQGSQWQWSAFYRNEGIVTSGKTFVRPLVMEVPIDEPVHIHLVSNDVMHEFFLPVFFFMRNAMPGHPNDFTWTPTKLGTFNGQCAEFCGLGHYQMRFVLKVVSEADFLDWVKKERRTLLSITCPATPGNTLQITAKNISWNTNCLAITPGQPATITVTNLDSGINHNFAIWNSIDTAHQFFATGKFSGVATRSDPIPTLPVGKYYFQCNVHGPAMSGVFIVGSPKGGGS
jgi:cytochrome c oxidase subunit II